MGRKSPGGRVEGNNVTTYGGAVYVTQNGGTLGTFAASGGQITAGTAETAGPCVYIGAYSDVTLSGDVQIGEFAFGESSADTLTVEGSFTGKVVLDYPDTVSLSVMTDIGNSLDGDVSSASISFMGIPCITAQISGSELVVAAAADGHEYTSVVTAPTCTQAGYTTHTCANCDDNYIDNVLAALSHSYADGFCTVCGAEDPDYVTQPTINLKYPTLTFEDVIVMNVYFEASDLEDVTEMGLITYKSQVCEWNVDNAEFVVPGYSYNESTTLYSTTTQGIPAKELGDTMWFAVYARLTDGSYMYTKLVSYSPETYAYSQLASGNSSMNPLVVAMLKYGAAAQTYFNYNTEGLVDRNLTEEQLAMVESYRADMMDDVVAPDNAKTANFVRNGGFTTRYPSITFEGAFAINYYCVPSAAPVGGITMYYWNQEDFDAADVLTVENATDAMKMTDESIRYAAAVEGIAAKDLDKGIYVAFVYSDGTTECNSGILSYSIGTYCVVQAANDDALAPFAQVTAVYGYYAKELFY